MAKFIARAVALWVLAWGVVIFTLSLAFERTF